MNKVYVVQEVMDKLFVSNPIAIFFDRTKADQYIRVLRCFNNEAKYMIVEGDLNKFVSS